VKAILWTLAYLVAVGLFLLFIHGASTSEQEDKLCRKDATNEPKSTAGSSGTSDPSSNGTKARPRNSKTA